MKMMHGHFGTRTRWVFGASVAVGALVLAAGCDRHESRVSRRNNPPVENHNALTQQPGTPSGDLRMTTTVLEGLHKPPPDKPYDDEERNRVRPEWYGTGQPQNPYPAGTMIPINPPGTSPNVAPGQPGMQPLPAMQPYPGQPGMQPIPAPGQQPGMQPTQPGMQPGMQPAQPNGNGTPMVTMTPMGTPSPINPGMQPVPMPQQPQQPAQQAPQMGGPVQNFEGDLGPSSQQGTEGRFQAAHMVDLRRGQRVAIALNGTFDTFLRVEPPTGEAMENDDATPNDLNSRLDFTAPIDGRYRVIVTSYAPGMAGHYNLTVTSGAPGEGLIVVNPTGAPQGGPNAQTGAGGTLAAGAPVSEQLTPADPASGGRYVRSYHLAGRQGDLVNLRLESSAFDPTLALISPTGQRWTNDDTSPSDTNSTVSVTLPAAGDYRVEVSSYRTGATGPFTLSLTAAGQPTVGPGGVATGTVAGRHGAGTMYGVFVGITDYGGSNNLYGCADDARQLAQAYINAHLGTAQQFIVLTDGEATVANVRNAFQTMQQRVGPEDVFMFFHSGHGSRHASTNPAQDPDGSVESIVLRDGEITSHDMAALFEPLRSDVDMLALDSCFSGGFQRAFSAAPNRYGMYSSEADVLSQVAQRYQAGGYLSYFLRRGVSEGDTNHDGTLRAGELADYLRQQYATNHEQLRTSDGSDVDTWQNLVLDRSGVAVNDPLWRFPVAAR